MSYGLTKETLQQMIDIFTQISRIEEVILYGSRAIGSYREGSDIDLALKGKDLDISDLLKLGAALEELDLPYHFDLLIFERIENSDLITHIGRVGKTIYVNKQGDGSMFVVKGTNGRSPKNTREKRENDAKGRRGD